MAVPIGPLPKGSACGEKAAFEYLDPLRYFLVVLRGVYLKGVGFAILAPQLLAMAVLGIVLLTLSVFRFHKALD